MVATRVRNTPLICGFCATGNHNHCPRAVRNGNGSVVICNCGQPYCGGLVLRCLECKNETEGEVSPDDWRCLDRAACAVAVKKRLDGNVHVQMVREVVRRVSENPGTETAPKAPKAPKAPTLCLHCGEPTAGGLFRPGHDAKFIAEKVRAVVDEGSVTADAVSQDMKDRNMSESLQKKFAKSVELTRKDRERRVKLAEEAKAKAEAKAQEDADKAAKKAAKGEEPTVVAPEGDSAEGKSKARKLTSASQKS